jgi:outer membrane protein assembly factor BamE (lipoprotein component of BamABCDE complex)
MMQIWFYQQVYVNMVSDRTISQWLRHCGMSVAAISLTLGLTSCAAQVSTHGNSVESDRVAQIVPGLSSQQDVEGLLGSPSSISVLNGQEWYYIGSRYRSIAFLEPDVVERQVLTVTFNPDGIVQSIDAINAENGRKVQLVKRETRTRGNDLTIVQQLLGNVGRFEE